MQKSFFSRFTATATTALLLPAFCSARHYQELLLKGEENIFLSGHPELNQANTGIDIELKNLDNRYYSNPFMFGSNLQNISLVLDSQTDWTIVLSKDCAVCATGTDRYDRMASSTSQASNLITTTTVNFGNGQLVGRTFLDTVCLVTPSGAANVCTDQSHAFFAVTNFNNMTLAPSYSGVLGVAPDDPSNGPSFVATLKNDGKINKKIVGMQINKFPTRSFATIGGTNQGQMYQIDGAYPVNYHKSTNNLRWKIKAYDMMFKHDNGTYDRIDGANTGAHSADATVDSFYRAVLIPTAIFTQFTQLVDKIYNKTAGPLKGNLFCDDGPSSLSGYCYVQGAQCKDVVSSFKDYVIELSDSLGYTVTPDSYLLDTTSKNSDGSNTTYCNILIQRNNVPNHQNEYVLGTVFMYSYYVVFDLEQNQIGFNGKTINFTEVPSDQGGKGGNGNFGTYLIVAIVVGSALILAIAIGCLIRMRNKKLREQLTQKGEVYETLD